MRQWSVTVSDEVDQALQDYLGSNDIGEEAFSHFVEDAVKSKLFELTVESIKTRNQQYDQNEIELTFEEAIQVTRADRT